ncbi:hypothetical protein ACFL6T_06925 [Candidatus Zixiibacteriota bacterium]
MIVTIRPLAGEGDTPGIPLLCPECGHGMQIISFITDPPVVDNILRHLKWRPGEAFLPNGRSPPAELKVAESLLPAQSPRSA